jgi:hypothetical protein
MHALPAPPVATRGQTPRRLQVLPLLHVMHDSSHASLGHNETMWKFFGRLTLDWMGGASMISWHHQHTVGHHLYTNIFQTDPDLPMATDGDVRRLVPRQAWSWVYRFQWMYLPILYGVLTMRFRIQDVTDTWLG